VAHREHNVKLVPYLQRRALGRAARGDEVYLQLRADDLDGDGAEPGPGGGGVDALRRDRGGRGGAHDGKRGHGEPARGRADGPEGHPQGQPVQGLVALDVVTALPKAKHSELAAVSRLTAGVAGVSVTREGAWALRKVAESS
jgi:hypothetical protein